MGPGSLHLEQQQAGLLHGAQRRERHPVQIHVRRGCHQHHPHGLHRPPAGGPLPLMAPIKQQQQSQATGMHAAT